MSRSLIAIFSRPYGQPKKMGPYASLRLEGEAVRGGAGGPVIAVHRDHEWHADGEKFSRLDFEGRVKVYFDFVDGTISRKYGPFEAFSAVDGVAFRGRSVFAFVEPDIGQWYCHDDGRHWPLMVVEPAG